MSQSLECLLFSNMCLSLDMHESILFLKNPQLLYDITEKVNNSLDIDVPNIINPSYNLKNDKKNKVNFKNLDNIDNKKNKLKNKKRVRSKIYVDKDFVDTTEELDLNNLSALPFLRPPKNIKSKKNNKSKVALTNNHDQSIVESNEEIAENDNKQIYLDNLLTVQELAQKLRIPSTEIIKWLFLQGISVTINQLLDLSIATLVAENYSFRVLQEKIQYNSLKIDAQQHFNGCIRSPVVTILGHVDHGKTTLLNCIRKANNFNQEAGNITQAIGSYEVYLDNDQDLKKIIFLDTPGHESFISMRTRGAEITDIMILVVSADDGLKPQTIEAINHIQKRNLPFIVAINKIDKLESNFEMVKKELSAFNILESQVPIIGISALNGYNIDLLLSSLIKLSKAQNLMSDPSQLAEGIILESYLDRQRGPIAKLLIQNGTLSIGDIVVSGNTYGKVKAILDGLGTKVGTIKSNSLAEILGFPSVPGIGLQFKVVEDEKIAKKYSAKYIALKQVSNSLNNRIVLDKVNIGRNKSIGKQINLIIKTDVQGSIDPIIHAFSKIPQDKVQVNILTIASGEISLKDIQLASTSTSHILTFNVNVPSSILDNAQQVSVAIKQFTIIYDLIDYIKNYMLTFVEIQYKKEIIGHAEVKSIFSINKGLVAGCLITDGKLKKDACITVIRNGKMMYDGILNSLKRGKDNIEESLSGYECGVMCQDYNLWETNDIIEAYIQNPLEKSL